MSLYRLSKYSDLPSFTLVLKQRVVALDIVILNSDLSVGWRK